ncbi:LytTR family transcriptional regulator DNA-binding domain-containing protein [Paenibacillus alvei]|uniref:LytTR family transcriptional regulator DNA-binding domain-containing protein n=1 Tax=Paenibacillus alvei TaxID=44250 RepID=A0ABT4H773_PAEAL|nr:LytTR family transcriptional regulator DNA-binding domain-containing protein [Paenibacillus alvei]MCY9764744.1 LytTR family transcriptional regulator DNA-binding domain-containing protein [Paenibacillus alvei]MCY9771201.1 LytTR family transcriptional regulator DNA-binding domain-containing protein [Paenibacillus alvei]
MYTHVVSYEQILKLNLIHDVVVVEYKHEGRRILFHTNEGYKKNITSLRHVHLWLKPIDYVRSDQFLINVRHVIGLNGDKVYMSNGMQVPLSRRGKKELKRLLKKEGK